MYIYERSSTPSPKCAPSPGCEPPPIVILGGWVFLMSEVPLYTPQQRVWFIHWYQLVTVPCWYQFS